MVSFPYVRLSLLSIQIVISINYNLIKLRLIPHTLFHINYNFLLNYIKLAEGQCFKQCFISSKLFYKYEQSTSCIRTIFSRRNTTYLIKKVSVLFIFMDIHTQCNETRSCTESIFRRRLV